MTSLHQLYEFSSDGISFVSREAARMRMVYFPLCGPSAENIKSAITPFLSGDIKIDKDRFLTRPASREDLRHPVREFYVHVEGQGVSSLSQGENSPEDFVENGLLWHKLVRHFPSIGIRMEAVNFIPVSGENAELMKITVKNTGKKNLTITPTAVIPIFGRALANKHDHEHVTALLHRIYQLPQGVLVEPTMLFNEEKHRAGESAYYVFGTGDGANPSGTFPVVEYFSGEGACSRPGEAVLKNLKPELLCEEYLNGKEAVGALRFKEKTLGAGASMEFVLALGIAPDRRQAEDTFEKFNTIIKFDQALEKNRGFWQEKIRSIDFSTGDKDYNNWTRWVMLQPVLRRIFGNSFLPDHDYGKGGKGWRDLWQDLLSLILIEPQNVREGLVNNFSGVRIDGSNATIIGTKPGEFLADRNNITRVWMDHGVWPLLTTLLYVHQTGDFDILLESVSYFRDGQLSRTMGKDRLWNEEYGRQLKSRDGKIYTGTILEHLLIQNLVQFFNVGEHNIIRLESADWNDGLDMAFERGESVAFMSFYGGNLLALAELLEVLSRERKTDRICVALELMILLDTLTERKCDYNNAWDKKKLLTDMYFKSVQPEISGEQIDVKIVDLIEDLRRKAGWIFDHLRRQEKIGVEENGRRYEWFNGYYDNRGDRVEGRKDEQVRMTLTGQVFPIMSGLAGNDEIKQIWESAGCFLRDKNSGGFRLNTDFKLRHYLDLGRAFGFAYGTKENGAFFNHMSVMFAFALYRRGFIREGREVLASIYRMSIDTDKSRIYPGVPEYFDSLGRGMYPYLTGSASWLILTMLTEVFGVRGHWGGLVLSPKLAADEFDENGRAEISCFFAGKNVRVTYVNPEKREFDSYGIKEVQLNDRPVSCERPDCHTVKIARSTFDPPGPFHIRVTLQ